MIDPQTGAIHPEALRIVQEINSYTERSPSGRGLRIFTLGTLPDGWRNTKKWRVRIEMYDGCGAANGGGRYLTFTGHHLEGTPTTVEERTAALASLHARVARDLAGANGNGNGAGHHHVVDLADHELLERARRAKHGDRFGQLYDLGDWQGAGYGSQSEADLALARDLAFWTNRDPARMDLLFRASRLMRGKWDQRHGRATYGALTIEKALDGSSDGYAGPRPLTTSPVVEVAVGSPAASGAARANAICLHHRVASGSLRGGLHPVRRRVRRRGA